MSPSASATDSFFALLRSNRTIFVAVIVLAFVLRLGFIFLGPDSASRPGDARYYRTATNLLAGHGYSEEPSPPYRPQLANVPAYPFFIASVYVVTGERPNAVRVGQAALDVITGILVAFLAFSLAPTRFKKTAAFAALLIYGFASWFTMIWVTCILAETLTIFLTTLTLALGVVALQRREKRWWALVGLTTGLALLTRPDSVLLLSALALFLVGRAVLERIWQPVANMAILLLVIMLTLAPWTIRNYLVFGVVQPLASEYGCVNPCEFPTGYLHWVRTWLKDMTHFDYAFNPAWERNAFDIDQLPRDAYDSEEEKMRIASLAERYHLAGNILTRDIDADFRKLANERIRRAPLRFFLGLPLYRSASLWLTGFSTSHATPYIVALRVLSVLPIHVAALLCFAIWSRRRPLAKLFILVVVVRTLFLAFHYAPETRYVVEAYPPVIAACAVTVAAVWNLLWKLWDRKQPSISSSTAR
jgi:4-amino-4-deoxy-L-arabinose transferase-like glycosyltransferase